MTLPESQICAESRSYEVPITPHKRLGIPLNGPCKIWAGAICGNPKYPYGNRRFKGVSTTAHRAAYIETFGPVSPDLDIDHLCGNRLCVNPYHLEAVTHKENCRRRNIRTHCKRGHLLTPENWYTGASDGKRRCKACYAIRSQSWRSK